MQTPLHSDSTTQTPPEIIKIARPTRRVHIPHLFGWLFAGFAASVLAGLSFPGGGHIQVRGMQTKAMAQAKQIGLALKLFAVDHDGNYPRQGIPVEMTASPKDSNTAFACLFPAYIENETIFGNKLSAYQTAQPDNVFDQPYIGRPKETLQPGENVYGYVMGLTENDVPSLPVVMDGTDGHGHYCTDAKKHGGVWKGLRAVVVHLDNSAALATLAGPDDARFIPRDQEHPASSFFDFSGLGKSVTLLDPAVGPRRK